MRHQALYVGLLQRFSYQCEGCLRVARLAVCAEHHLPDAANEGVFAALLQSLLQQPRCLLAVHHARVAILPGHCQAT